MATQLIANNDAQFDITQKQFIVAVSATPDKVGLLGSDVTGLKTAQGDWTTAYPAHIKAQQDALAATQAKERARRNLERLVRLAARKLNGHPGVDNGIRTLVGLPAQDGVRTPQSPPATRPVVNLLMTHPLTLLIDFHDELTPRRAARPKGVRGCQIWVYVGDTTPADVSAYRFVTLATRAPYSHQHEDASGGRTAFYLLRWQGTKGATGPFSEVVQLFIIPNPAIAAKITK